MKNAKKIPNSHINQKKGVPSDEHWQILLKRPDIDGNDPASAFLPRPAKNRATPHAKINDCDY